MVEDRIAALESRAATLEERVRELEGRRAPWDVTRPESPRAAGESIAPPRWASGGSAPRGAGESVAPPRAGDARGHSGAPAWAGGEAAPGGAGASPWPLVASGPHAWR